MRGAREIWNNRVAFILAAIGSAIGLGNIWRFPAVAFQNGGGAFLIPYFVALFTAGIPIMMIEFWLGRTFQASAPNAFEKIRKGWRFFGWIAVFASAVIIFYYAVVMSWCWVFLFKSLSLPWKGKESAFFFHDVLNIADKPGVFDGFVWPIVIGLILTWLLIYWIIYKGVGRVGKIVMITVPLPVLLIGILAIRGLTLPGAIDGIAYYLTPNFKMLLDPKVWLGAYSQIFFSLSLGFGVLLAYASYLPKNSDITNNAFITSLANCSYSFFSGFAVFSVLGYLAKTSGVAITSLKIAGPTLAFITYPAALAQIPLAPILAVIFFITLLTLGIDSAFSIVEGLVTAVLDNSKISRKKATFWVSLISFFIGLIFTTRSGLYWLDVVDHFIMYYVIAFVGLIQCLLVGWYGDSKKIAGEIDDSSEFKMGNIWRFMIRWIAPAILSTMIILNLVSEITKVYEGYPYWLIFIGGWGVLIAVLSGAIFLYKKIKI